MMNNDPRLWSELLEKLPANYVLMGGAVRDFYSTVEAKDYDIFHPYAVGMPIVPAEWKYVEMDYNDPIKFAEHQKDYLTDDNGNPSPVGSVYNFDVPFGWDSIRVQMIGVHYQDPVAYMANFDHTLTLAAYSKQNGLYYSPQFIDSMNTRTIRCLNYRKNSLDRASAAVAKVDPFFAPHWEYINFHPQENQEGIFA